VTVTDTDSGTSSTPTGSVSLTQSPLLSGSFSGSTCSSVARGGGSFSYTPAPGSECTITLTGSYNGDTNHAISSGHKDITATTRSTSTAVSCTPLSVPVNSSTSCTVTVTDTDSGTSSTPTGSVSLTQSPLLSGSFSGSTCAALSSGSCSFSYTPAPGSEGTITLTGSYN